MPEPRLIVFVGPVGSGKSTQMKLLSEHLKLRRFKVRTARIKVGNLWAYPIYNVASKHSSVFRSRRLFKLWVISDLFALSLKFFINLWLPYKAKHIVLVEDYLPAAVADYLHIARINGHSIRNLSIILAYICRLATILSFASVFLDAKTEVLKGRWKLRGTIDEKSEYIFMQRTVLPSLTKFLSQDFIYIDTSDKTIQEVNKYIEKCFIGVPNP